LAERLQGEGGEAFQSLGDDGNSISAAHALSEVRTSALHWGLGLRVSLSWLLLRCRAAPQALGSTEMMTNSVTLPGTQCKARGGSLARRCLQKSGGSGGSPQTHRMFASLQSADCSPSASQALSAMEEAEVLARRCLQKFGGSPGGGGTTASTPPVTPTMLSRSIPNAPSFAHWQRPGESFT